MGTACTFFGHRDCPSSIKPKLCEVLIDLIEIAIALFKCANLEYVRVIPTFTKSRVREDKSCRLIEGQKSFFVLEDQVVSRDIIRELASTLELAVDASSCLLIDTEVSSMYG